MRGDAEETALALGASNAACLEVSMLWSVVVVVAGNSMSSILSTVVYNMR